ncbi:hypothetical protein [Nocardia iowensis]|uniref:Uncharacterized protein n=1 Tax=Nocardia iowensis TaxID=204891 RepID=A0ABX8RIV2_NOCIO|nr:hypothetical protein [Nocardia iowensis]QXN88834.1 hypothetical protein KV110_24995 [Nocardia iowensis]
MTKDSIPLHTHHTSTAGLPLAADWVRHFAVVCPPISPSAGIGERLLTACRRRVLWLPRQNPQNAADLVRHSPVWSDYAVKFLFAHQHCTLSHGTTPRGVDTEVHRLVHAVDNAVADLVDIPIDDVEIGALLSRMAQRWLLYRAFASDLNIAGLLKAQRDYNTAVEQLPMLRTRRR